MRRRSAIVLAGGASRRFGRDKLAEPVRGRSLLDRAIAAVAAVADDVLVVGAAGPEALATPADTTVRRIPDALPGEGPLAALPGALREARHGVAIVVAGDMPDLVPSVLDLLLTNVEHGGSRAAVLETTGSPAPLPVAVDVAAGELGARVSLTAGESSLRALLARLVPEVVPASTWRALDPAGATLRDVDSEEDLADTERRPRSRRASCGRK